MEVHLKLLLQSLKAYDIVACDETPIKVSAPIETAVLFLDTTGNSNGE